MSREIVKRLTPEEEELLRKREELAGVRGALAERELELADLRSQLKSFEGRYLRQVGILYAELDNWEAKIAEIEASLNPSPTTSQRAGIAQAGGRNPRGHSWGSVQGAGLPAVGGPEEPLPRNRQAPSSRLRQG